MTTGACPYCGQMKDIEVLNEAEVSTEMIDDMVMLQCDCQEAINEQRRRNKIEKAEKDIESLFADADGIQAILKEGLRQLVGYQIDSLTIKNGLVSAKLAETAKGGIKVERTITKKESLES